MLEHLSERCENQTSNIAEQAYWGLKPVHTACMYCNDLANGIIFGLFTAAVLHNMAGLLVNAKG